MNKILPLPVEILHREVKSPRLFIRPDRVVVILPSGYDAKFANLMLERHRRWIMKKHATLKKASEVYVKLMLENRNMEDFKKIVYDLVEKYSKELKVKPRKIFFRKMKTRWGSCSGRNNITINSLLRFLPDELIEYIIYHEMCHILEKNHGKTFWRMVHQKFPDSEDKKLKLIAYELKLFDYLPVD
ncbi:MAG: hypothetical protein PWP37_924 [Thermotogota bacterium]|nr:hypothetical protein [Thermotogota bacterium]